MLVIVGFVSQKGGVGKSALARALATTTASVHTNVKIADLDVRQETVKRWEERREETDAGRPIVVEGYETVADAIQGASLENQLLIIDGPPRASRGTFEIARRADLVVQPTGAGIDDLDPAILLFHELTRAGIPHEKLVIALSRMGSEGEANFARRYVEKAGYGVLPGSIAERTAYREAHNRGQSVAEIKHANPQADVLMQALLGMITERVKARVRAARIQSKQAGRKG
jgi:chromosome partitioning protein